MFTEEVISWNAKSTKYVQPGTEPIRYTQYRLPDARDNMDGTVNVNNVGLSQIIYTYPVP